MKPKMLICIDWFDPAYKAGGPIRSVLNVIKYALKDYDVFLLTSDHDLDEEEPLKNINSDTWIEHNSGARICYLSRGNLNFKHVFTRIKEIDPQIMYLNSQFSKPFTIFPLIVNRFFKRIDKVVLAPRGMLKDRALSQKRLKKSVYNNLMRRTLLTSNVVFQSTDDSEHEEIIQRMKLSRQQVVKAGNVPIHIVDKNFERTKMPICRFILVSRLVPHKNIDFLLSSLMTIRRPLTLTLVGAFSSEKYQSKCQGIIDQLPGHITVEQKGAQSPGKIPDLLEENQIFILPTKGENFGHSIFEAFAHGLPVIIGRNVPWTDIERKSVGWLIDETNVDQMTECIEASMEMGEQEYLEMSKNALQYAKSYFENENFEKQYDALFA